MVTPQLPSILSVQQSIRLLEVVQHLQTGWLTTQWRRTTTPNQSATLSVEALSIKKSQKWSGERVAIKVRIHPKSAFDCLVESGV